MCRRFTASASVCFHLPHSEMKRGRDESAGDEKSCRVGLKRHLRLILSLIVGLFGEKKHSSVGAASFPPHAAGRRSPLDATGLRRRNRVPAQGSGSMK